MPAAGNRVVLFVMAAAILFDRRYHFSGWAIPMSQAGGDLSETDDNRSAAPGTSAPFQVLLSWSRFCSLNLIGDGLNDALNPKLRDR